MISEFLGLLNVGGPGAIFVPFFLCCVVVVVAATSLWWYWCNLVQFVSLKKVLLLVVVVVAAEKKKRDGSFEGEGGGAWGLLFFSRNCRGRRSSG